MTFVAIPNAWRCSLIFEYKDTGLLAVNTIGVRDGSPPTIERAGIIGGVLATWWETSMKSHVASTCQLNEVRVVDASSEVGVSLSYVTGLPVSGTNSNPPAPVNAAPIVTFRTEGRGRSSRGRNYVVGVISAAFGEGDGATLGSDWQGILFTAYTALNNAIAAQDADHAVLSSATATAIPITAYQARSYVGTQRRRASSP